MSKDLTLSKALRAEGYDLLSISKEPRIRGGMRVTLYVGRYDPTRPIPDSLTMLERDDIRAIVKEFFPEAVPKSSTPWGQEYRFDVPKGARPPIGIPGPALRRRRRQLYESWYDSVISAARSRFNEDD